MPILTMASTDHQFAYLYRAMGRPELAEDERYRSNAERDTARPTHSTGAAAFCVPIKATVLVAPLTSSQSAQAESL
jgi:crotonobetainyl-CoA:carnitine CoA-transferase CaiB-like acyl-CoA transferase